MKQTSYTHCARSIGSENPGPQPAPSAAVSINLEGRTVIEVKENQYEWN